MRITALLIGAVLLLGLGTARRADACGGGGSGGNYDGLIAAGLVIGGTYVGVTGAFAIKDLAGDDHSVGYGVAETLVNAPIAGLFGLGLAAQIQSEGFDTGAKTLLVFTAIHTALAAHGVYTIGKHRAPKGEQVAPRPYMGPPGTFQVGRVTAVVTPAPVASGGGLGLTGVF